MTNRPAPEKPAKQGKTREDRLKAALKANMARRKAQARARNAQEQTEVPDAQAQTQTEGEDPQERGG